MLILIYKILFKHINLLNINKKLIILIIYLLKIIKILIKIT